ncbi:hypothetical protein OKW28_005176 [Paraburkholderia sp. 40]
MQYRKLTKKLYETDTEPLRCIFSGNEYFDMSLRVLESTAMGYESFLKYLAIF